MMQLFKCIQHVFFFVPQGYIQTLNVNTLLLFTRKPHREYFIIKLPTGSISLKAVLSFDVWYTSLLVVTVLEVILFNCFYKKEALQKIYKKQIKKKRAILFPNLSDYLQKASKSTPDQS